MRPLMRGTGWTCPAWGPDIRSAGGPAGGGRAPLGGNAHDFFNGGDAVDGDADRRLLERGEAALAELGAEPVVVAAAILSRSSALMAKTSKTPIWPE